MAQACLVGVVLTVALASLGLNLVALLTDNWYSAETDGNVNPDIQKTYNFHFGLWKLCYDDMPTNIANDDKYSKDGKCVYIHDQLIQEKEEDLDYDSRLRIHLSRTVLGCAIAEGATILAGLLSLICGLCPLCCDQPAKKPMMFLSASILLLLATMCGAASGIAFIAVRDLDNTTERLHPVMPPVLPEYVTQMYQWSFMVHWGATGLAFIDSFLLLCLLRNNYENVGEDVKYRRYTHM